jgi:DNA-binding LacI/PurR family transcriptional regulator
MGRQAISLLLQQIEGEHLDTPIITVSPQLILRDSAPTAP